MDIYNLVTWNINDASVRVDSGKVTINGAALLSAGNAILIADGGETTIRNIAVSSYKTADIIAKNSSIVRAFGIVRNHDADAQFIIDDSVLKLGSEFK